jgi:ADP-heptose:LPS heptosyltransferase
MSILAARRPRIVTYVDLDLIGDALIKLPLVRAQRHAFPDGELIWVAGRGRSAFAGALAPLMTGLLDRVIQESGVDQGLADALGPEPIDLLIDTQSRLGTALALRRLRPRRFVSASPLAVLAGRMPRALHRRPRWLIRELLDMLECATGQPAMPDGNLALPHEATALAAELLPAGPNYVAQATGTGGKHKAWPIEHHVALANALIASGHTPVMILGPDEQQDYPGLAAALPAAQFPLQQAAARNRPAGPDLTIAVGARCAAAVAADCGGGHMLAASGTPMVSLFGPTNPVKFAPWSSRLTVLCAQDWGSPDMAAIPVPAVLEAVLASLA